jgi:pilus assembly protein Flp/PilA
MLNALRALLGDDQGATLVEYALVCALIAVACVFTLTKLGHQVAEEFKTIRQALK